jgi:molybdopterin-guanine dinucleotide biosynthesis protein A
MVGRVELRARAAILAGGRARRLGGEKPTAELAGRPLIAYPLAAAAGARLEPFVVAKGETVLPQLDCEVTVEPDLPVHPLRGILTALEHAGGPVLVLGCDMPFVTAPLLTWLAAWDPPAVAEVDGRIEPLLAIYGPADAPRLEAALEREGPLREAVTRLEPQRVGEAQLGRFGDPRDLARSVNTEADLAQAARLLSR